LTEEIDRLGKKKGKKGRKGLISKGRESRRKEQDEIGQRMEEIRG
jgi:hypothetical protein